MSFATPRRVTIATTATRIDDVTNQVSFAGFAIQNLGTVTVYVGKSTVTTADGFPIAAGATLALNGASITQATGLYGIVASGTAQVAVLQVNT